MEEEEETLITTTQCADRRGVRRQTIFNAVKRGDIPFVRYGRDYLLKVEDCDAYEPMRDHREAGKKGAARRWHAEEEKP